MTFSPKSDKYKIRFYIRRILSEFFIRVKKELINGRIIPITDQLFFHHLYIPDTFARPKHVLILPR